MASAPTNGGGKIGLHPNQLFEDRYRIESVIGTGGFARVYRATQIDIGRTVAIKLLLPKDFDGSLDDSPYETNLVERFQQEAKLLSRLRDPHTITLYDFGRAENGLLYMVFEFIDGQSLKELIADEAPIAPERVMKILFQSLESLQEAHSLGVLHRDIKPGNIMVYSHVGKADQAKILDFGIAKTVREEHGITRKDLTSEGVLVGTPRYMSPEQLHGRTLTASTDIYSLGLVCYELLTGRQAIQASDTMQIIAAQLKGESFELPPDIPLPDSVRRIVNRMMLKDRKHRYSTAEAVLSDLKTSMNWGSGEYPSINDSIEFKQPTKEAVRAVENRASDDASERMIPQYDLGSETPVPGAVDSTPSLESEFPRFAARNDAARDDAASAPEEAPAEIRDDGSNRTRMIAIVGIILLSVSIGALLLLKSDDGPTASEETLPAKTTVSEQTATAGSSGESATEADDVAEGGNDDHNDNVAEPETVAAATPKTMQIRTEPIPVLIRIDGVAYGKSPVTVRTERQEFPFTIEAVYGSGRIATQRIQSPREEIVVPLPAEAEELARAEEEDEKEKTAKPDSRPEPKPRPTSTKRPDPKPKPKPDPGPPAEEGSDSDDDDGEGRVMMPKLDGI